MPRLVIYSDGQAFAFRASKHKKVGWDSFYGNVVDVSEEDMARWEAIDQAYYKLQEELGQLYMRRKRK